MKAGVEGNDAGHDYASHRERVRKRLRRRGAAGALACPGPNLQYLTGFRGEPVDRFHALYIPVEGDATLVTPAGYLTQAQRNASVDKFRTVPGNDPGVVADALAERHEASRDGSDGTLLVDEQALHALTRGLYDALGPEAVGSAASIFDGLRRRKAPDEVAALRRSAAVADAVSVAVRSLGAGAVGQTEAELASVIRAELHERNTSEVAFDVVVASGPNGSEPGVRAGEREIRPGDPVILDFGCLLEGYASDQSRTVVFDGEPSEAFRRAHGATLAALEAGVAAIEPGATTGDVDAAARETLTERGYGEQFVHDTGHGVGLAAHEDLSIAAGGERTLEEGMVFSVEPGVYLDDFGVRIEDLVVVTDDGCERLNGSPRTWQAL